VCSRWVTGDAIVARHQPGTSEPGVASAAGDLELDGEGHGAPALSPGPRVPQGGEDAVEALVEALPLPLPVQRRRRETGADMKDT
jgi:hypothetical protein